MVQIDDQATFNALSSNHSARLSDRFYGGLSLDLIIEMVLMRNIKSSGGLTHGKGFSEVHMPHGKPSASASSSGSLREATGHHAMSGNAEVRW